MTNEHPQNNIVNNLIEGDLVLSPTERARAEFLVVEPENKDRDMVRNTLKSAGFTKLYIAPDHMAGISALQSRNFTHVIFCAKNTNMPTTEFVSRIVEISPKIVLIASSHEPQADDVFELLRLGARGFLVKPYSGNSLDAAVVLATKGNPLPDAVLHAKNRNEAFAALMAAALDKSSELLRQAQHYSTAKEEYAQSRAKSHNIVRIAKMFAQGGEAMLLKSIVELFISISEGPATSLGRLRSKLRQKRAINKSPGTGELR